MPSINFLSGKPRYPQVLQVDYQDPQINHLSIHKSNTNQILAQNPMRNKRTKNAKQISQYDQSLAKEFAGQKTGKQIL